MKLFYSKRNHVVLSKGVVVKTFVNTNNFLCELEVYEKLDQSGLLNIPKIIEVDTAKHILVLEYLEGFTVLEVLESLEIDNDVDSAVKLILKILNWLDGFYDVFSGTLQVMGDINLRNFIWYKEAVYGIDFEKSCMGDRFSEKAELLARYYLYDPGESVFKGKVIYQVTQVISENDRMEKMISEQVALIKIRRSGGRC